MADDVEAGIRISKVCELPDGTGAPPVAIAMVPGQTVADIVFGPDGELSIANFLDAV